MQQGHGGGLMAVPHQHPTYPSVFMTTGPDPSIISCLDIRRTATFQTHRNPKLMHQFLSLLLLLLLLLSDG
jgi:hypothetical protein